MKSKFARKRTESDEMSLQITSMADIFTILLVFLLKSYAASAMTVTPSAGMSLPQAFGQDSAIDALKVEISEKSVNVEGQSVATLEGYRFNQSDIQANGTSQSLSKALDRERQRQVLIAKANSDVKVDPRIIVISDRHVPYSTVKSVLASAALNGYTDFKLAVVKGE
ncbi:MAG: biopolymer transporter ExbD [Oligoflexia bacterium]|nr:biopolymer transporter ExbD [Oligoflexia bacterium]